MKRITSHSMFIVLLTLLAVPSVVQAARPNDEMITAWVKESLRADPRVHESMIDVSTNDGIVTLSGEVTSVAGRHYAALAAEKIKGVRGVLNDVKVMPTYRFDADIAHDIRRRYLGSVSLESQHVRVDVSNGTVTLTGAVDSWAERDEAELLAGEVVGVKGVENDLSVEYRNERSDGEVRDDVIAALRRDVYLTNAAFTITVKNGTVTLEGSVGSEYQKQRAEHDARQIQNVKSIDDHLDVEWWEDSHVRQQRPVPTNAELKDSVKLAIDDDLRIAPEGLDVEASYGHVTLRGIVPTFGQKRLAGEDAHNVVGVVWVSNLLSVRAERSADMTIRDDVKFAFDSDSVLSGQDVDVLVKDGVVTLQGTVADPHDKIHAGTLASKIRGVTDVHNAITVIWYPRYTDAALRERISDRLAANAETRWVANQIQVDVVDGKATLSGDVMFWAERDEAEKIALATDGILTVDNRLKVAGADYRWDDWH